MGMSVLLRAVVTGALVLVAPALARAQPESPTPDAGPPPDAAKAPIPDSDEAAIADPSLPPTLARDTYTAVDVADDPRPTEVSGIARRDDPVDWRAAPRTVLFVPRYAVWAAFAPLRLGMWAYDRFAVGAWISRLLSGDGKLVAHPTLRYDDEFGFGLGARVLHRDLFGHGESVRVKGSLGGEYNRYAAVRLGTGGLASPLRLFVETEIRRQDRARFTGIGNGDLADCTGSTMLAPDEGACATRFAQDVVRAELSAELALGPRVLVAASSAYRLRSFDTSASERDPDVAEIYDTAALVGYDDGLSNVYTELAASYDSRSSSRDVIAVGVPDTGEYVSAFAGYQAGTGDDPSRFWRYGAELHLYRQIWLEDRVLALRLYGEAVTGELDRDVPFVDLPSLGGRRLLRGYGTGRFRDRAMATASAEYHFPVHSNISAFLFSDAGRVFDRVRDVSVSDLHVGAGGGFKLHTAHLVVMTFQIGYGFGDDNVQVALVFEPTFKTKPRAQRY